MPDILIGIHAYEAPSRLRATLESLRADAAAGVGLLLLGDGADAATARALAVEFGEVAQSNTGEALGAAACFNRLVAWAEAEVYVLLEGGALVGPNWLGLLLAALAADDRNGLAGPSTNFCWNEQGVGVKGGATPREVGQAARVVAARYGSRVRTTGPLHSLSDFCYAVRREAVEAVGAADESYGLGPCWEMDYNARAARAGFRGVWACGAYVWRAPLSARRRREEAARFGVSRRRYQDKFCGARLRGGKSSYREHCRGDECPNFAPPTLIEIRRPLAATVVNVQAGQTDADTHAPEAALEVSAAFNTDIAVDAFDAGDAAKVVDVNGAAEVFHSEPSSSQTRLPLVTCVMPTCDRRAFVPQAVRYFQRQDYPNLELLVVDDGEDEVSDLLPPDPRIRYVRPAKKMSIGAKRNFACGQARGELIAHWDDDDWYAADRVSRQVSALLESNAEICGTSLLLFYEPLTRRAWRYEYADRRRAWVAGSSLVYRKEYWARHNFPDVRVGEDTRFVWAAPARSVRDLRDPALCVALIHRANTGRKDTAGWCWHADPPERVHALLREDLAFYRSAVAGEGTPPPLVSCVMPTYNRRPFVPLALASFARQTYANAELLVIDDGDDPVRDLCEGVAGVRHIRLTRRASIGAKRNLGCREARGEIIAHWDDDDWYAPDRLQRQVEPIRADEADLTGLVGSLVMELPDCLFWTLLPRLHASMFAGDVHGGTLAYRRALLSLGVRYPEANIAEDAALLRQAVGRGQRLSRLANEGSFVYVRHGRNAWREFVPGSFLDPAGWRRIDPPAEFPAEVLDAYRAAAAPARAPLPRRAGLSRLGV